ncbi:MAG: hypothetical protein WED09_05475 [Homoserinimonas sp.]
MVSPFSLQRSQSTSPSLSQTFGSSGRRGEQGEALYARNLKNFASAVAQLHGSVGLTYRVDHGLSIPTSSRDGKRFSGDVDFGISTGNDLLLVDVKFWAPGLYWSVPIPRLEHHPSRTLAFRGLGPHVEGKWIASQNMALATERYREALNPHGIQVSAVVVFIPTTSTRASNVLFMRWPGGIPSVAMEESFDLIHDLLGAPFEVNPATISLLNRMKK